MRVFTSALASIIVMTSIASLHAQSSQLTGSQPSVSVPRLIKFSGVFQPADGQPPASIEVVTLSIYAEQDGGVALWQEIQTVAVDTAGRYTVVLGASHPDGLPLEVFASGEARWMSLEFARPGEVERPRVRLTSVPYALKAEDAETLGGRPASAYLLAPTEGDKARRATVASAGDSSTATSQPTVAADVLPGTTNFLAKYVNSANVGNSAVYEIGGKVGIGTTAPLDSLHVRFTNTSGSLTGFAVQNMGNTATSYSGMLFYDQFGALGQFQGFGNVTHEYRINNIASNGSINFMLGTSRLKIDTTTGTTISGPASIVAGAVLTGLSVTSTSTDATSAAIDALDNAGYGVFANTDTGTAIFGGSANVAAAWAGFFDGDVNVTGTLTKAAGAFRIDHPLDPENKYLSHSFVESPDMKNIYDGVAVFDGAGEAIVTLPEWFEALNEDFRYQLTPMGAAFVPYVAEEIAGNQFKIGGGIAGRKVSWQVTGIRHDAYANAHRIQVEELKPAAAVGTYLHPDAFGQPVEKGRSTLTAEDSKPTAKDPDAARVEATKARLRAISPKPAKQ
jgi:hypothetical protein